MKSVMQSICFALVIAFAFSATVDEDADDFIGSRPGGSTWDFMVFSQQWPETVCTAWKERSKSNECSVPKDVTHWSVHGLWPSMSSGEGPQFCNRSWAFNMTELESIVTELEEHWPNIYKGTSLASFWEHEWTKHGTCAATDPIINSELKYFSTGLDLGSKYDLFTVLSDNNITPSLQTSYQLDDIHRAFQKIFHLEPIITCYKDNRSKRYLIKEIRICVDKELSLIPCPQSAKLAIIDEGCSPEGVVYYPPIVPTVISKKTEL